MAAPLLHMLSVPSSLFRRNEYITGFGSITAMTVGQMRNLKYYPVYDR